MANEPFDDYGFRSELGQELFDRYEQEVRPRLEERTASWVKYVDSIGGTDKIDVKSSRFKRMVRLGISSQIRPIVWCKLTGVEGKINASTVYSEMKSLRDAIPENVKRSIELDIPRTFSGAKGFNSDQLRDVLYAFSLAHPEIGYCQSLNFIASVLIAVVGEEPGFWMLCVIIEKYLPLDYYCNQMRGFKVDLEVMESLFTERVPDVARLAQKLDHEWMLTASGWILTLFSNSFPISTVVRIWDSFLLEGGKILFRVAIAALRMNRDRILATDGRGQLTGALNLIQRDMIDQDRLMDMAFAIKAFSRSHLIEMRKVAESKIDGLPDAERKNIGSSVQAILGQFYL